MSLTFDAQRADLVKVRVVDVRVHTEQPPQNRLGSVEESRREADTCGQLRVSRTSWCRKVAAESSRRRDEDRWMEWQAVVGEESYCLTDLLWEMLLVVQDRLRPSHERLDICRGREVCGLFATV